MIKVSVLRYFNNAPREYITSQYIGSTCQLNAEIFDTIVNVSLGSSISEFLHRNQRVSLVDMQLFVTRPSYFL